MKKLGAAMLLAAVIAGAGVAAPASAAPDQRPGAKIIQPFSVWPHFV